MTEYNMSKSKRLDELIQMVQISKDDKLNTSDIKEPSIYKTRFLSGKISDKIFKVVHDGEIMESDCMGNFICIKDYNYALHYVHTIDYKQLSLLEIMCNNDNQTKLIEALEELQDKLMKDGKKTMDRTLIRLDLLTKNTIGIHDEFDTDFADFDFDFKSGFDKHNSRNHFVIGVGDALINRGGVTIRIKGIHDDVITFNINSNHPYHPNVNKDIVIRPGVVAIYLDAEEISVIGAPAIYNIDKTTEEYVFSRFRFNKVPVIQFGRMATIIYDVYQDTERIHDGVERREGGRLYIDRPSYLISYEVADSKINIIQLECEDERHLPEMYKELHKLAYKVYVNQKPNIELNNL